MKESLQYNKHEYAYKYLFFCTLCFSKMLHGKTIKIFFMHSVKFIQIHVRAHFNLSFHNCPNTSDDIEYV